ncbi:AraC family transcriptional regulator [Mucilaginibacter sp. L3T2-6]|uniref:helix-turn-helix domain-containing protein n=1 Tax=Mucilaginibacter sp. L3T2-6 TaxID=3062491 RepID=UPI0026763A5B|nr:AraC family transcriptional regulator [Mucilaginibacter sp. L3T2-6]MDO3641469.1 AraC family transcriptional regulator [Mucilaginibacter sp. L3T2-6]MDV6213770.1 AraC family transcriptional regulator [Mucilaginibacter sp. L3T2-6]
MTLYIKNMVCPRCVKAVEQIFNDIGIKPIYVRLGEVLTQDPLQAQQLESLKSRLKQLGFELLDDSLKQQIDKIKSIIIQHIHYTEDEKFVFSEVLADELHKDYSVLSKLFSETEGITIEQYVILQRIEKVKELLVYNEMNLNEISYKLNYSSVAHLSAQFKKVTGLTPTQFKAQGIHLRKFLNEV